MGLANILEILHNVLLRKQVDLVVYLIQLSRQNRSTKKISLGKRKEDIFSFFIAIRWIKIQMYAIFSSWSQRRQFVEWRR